MNYKEKLHILRNDVLTIIEIKAPFKVPNELCFNLEGGRYLTNVTKNCLVDNLGYEYNFYVLDIEQLCKIADYLQQK
jgi:hypothetical protein